MVSPVKTLYMRGLPETAGFLSRIGHGNLQCRSGTQRLATEILHLGSLSESSWSDLIVCMDDAWLACNSGGGRWERLRRSGHYSK